MTELPEKNHTYQVSGLFLGIFYLLLFAWVLICLFFLFTIIRGFESPAWYRVFIVAFILFYMCYFSLALSYKLEVWDEGDIRLTSFRRTVQTHAQDIPLVEGPYLPIGFIRFRLEREKAYLFCQTSSTSLKNALSVIKKANPDIQYNRL
ncbi:MAG: hypothetical protein H8E81_05330 [Deltaproteobacteria bacterium]|nr:hypothetical protein [Deltaproteobacteria bacterium]